MTGLLRATRLTKNQMIGAFAIAVVVMASSATAGAHPAYLLGNLIGVFILAWVAVMTARGARGLYGFIR